MNLSKLTADRGGTAVLSESRHHHHHHHHIVYTGVSSCVCLSVCLCISAQKLKTNIKEIMVHRRSDLVLVVFDLHQFES